jgi:hypothetical protein
MYTDNVMTRRFHDLQRRLARAAVGCLLGGAMAVPLGPTTTSQAVNQMNATSTRALPSYAPREVVRERNVWVPARSVPLPGQGRVSVPGHFERRLDNGDVYVPPFTVRDPATGAITTLPAGTQPPSDDRLAP